jgi:hypothetical protein
MTAPSIPFDPYRIATDTWIIPQIVPAGPGVLASVNSMVIAGAEPVLVDTGCAVNRDGWLDQAFSIVDPADVRWVFISHADRDHIGNLDAVLAACPQATVITTASALPTCWPTDPRPSTGCGGSTTAKPSTSVTGSSPPCDPRCGTRPKPGACSTRRPASTGPLTASAPC